MKTRRIPQRRARSRSRSELAAMGGHLLDPPDHNRAIDGLSGMAGFRNTFPRMDIVMGAPPVSDRLRLVGSRAPSGSQTLVWVRKELF
jgi:hypothetical protein